MWTTAGFNVRRGGSGYSAMSTTGSCKQGIICSMPPSDYRNCSENEIMHAVVLFNLMNIYLDYRSSEYGHLLLYFLSFSHNLKAPLSVILPDNGALHNYSYNTSGHNVLIKSYLRFLVKVQY